MLALLLVQTGSSYRENKMDEYVVKYLLKKNPDMTKEEAEIKARKIWDDYCEQNKKRDEKREIEHKKQWDKALNSESYNTLFEYMDNIDSHD